MVYTTAGKGGFITGLYVIIVPILGLVWKQQPKIGTWIGAFLAAIPILYGGLLSVGIAYTLQVIAQRDAHPPHAAILLSLEAVFAASGGWLILGEIISARGLSGCGLMLSGMLLSQLWNLAGKTS